MESDQILRKIVKYSIISFLLPLVTINSCLLFYKFMGSIETFPNLGYGPDKIENSYKDFLLITNNEYDVSLTNCPEYKYVRSFITSENKVIKVDEKGNVINQPSDFLNDQIAKNKIKSVQFTKTSFKESKCVKNHKFMQLVLNNIKWVEPLLIKTIKENSAGFAEIKNPYIYGEVSISRTARYFPATFIFKPFIILSSIFLFFYWLNNFRFFNIITNKNNITDFSKKFFYFGILSCIFLALHAAFLGLDYDSKLFSQIRKLIIILFISFEVVAQIYLTASIFKIKNELKDNINYLVLNIKIIFVSVVFIVTLISFAVLSFTDQSSVFKQVLEWNYFSFLLFYYLLSSLLWKVQKNQKF